MPAPNRFAYYIVYVAGPVQGALTLCLNYRLTTANSMIMLRDHLTKELRHTVEGRSVLVTNFIPLPDSDFYEADPVPAKHDPQWNPFIEPGPRGMN